LFEIPKPIRTKGIGVDQLPAHIRNSHILTGNNLGRLGNVERLPTKEEIAEVMASEVQALPARDDTQAIHWLAQQYLMGGDTWRALCLLMGS